MLFGVTPPAYTIGSSKRQLHQTSNHPGPASYDTAIDMKTRNPQPVIGKAARHHHSKSTSPGPGTYTLQSSIGTGPKTVMTTRKNGDVMRRITTPGPGSYETKEKDSKIRYSFGSGSRMSEIGRATPGPGAYQTIAEVLPVSPKLKFNKATRDSPTHSHSPGPGNYSISSSFTDSAPRWSFTKSYRDGFGTEVTPGPGAYLKLNSTLPGPKPSMSPRRTLSTGLERNPGPGAYDFSSYQEAVAPAYSLGKSPRTYHPRSGSDSPSPHHYNPKPVLVSLPSITIGTGQRESLAGKPRVGPGPGNYNSKLPDKRLAFTIKPRLKDLDFEERKRIPVSSNQGPGDYSPEKMNVKEKAPATVIGKASRSMYDGGEKRPSPADFDLSREITGPKYSFGKAPDQTSIKEHPGPGHYDTPAAFGVVNRYSQRH